MINKINKIKNGKLEKHKIQEFLKNIGVFLL